MKIRTTHVYPPIPIRTFDWSAVDDDTYDGPGCLVGWGATEEEAVADLLMLLELDSWEDVEVEGEYGCRNPG